MVQSIPMISGLGLGLRVSMYIASGEHPLRSTRHPEDVTFIYDVQQHVLHTIGKSVGPVDIAELVSTITVTNISTPARTSPMVEDRGFWQIPTAP